jgi:hypothetical protein
MLIALCRRRPANNSNLEFLKATRERPQFKFSNLEGSLGRASVISLTFMTAAVREAAVVLEHNVGGLAASGKLFMN